MKLELKNDTKAETLATFWDNIAEDDKKMLKARAVQHYLGDGGFNVMRVGAFIDCANGDYTPIFNEKRGTAYEYLFALAFLDYAQEICDVLGKQKIPPHLVPQEQKQIDAVLPSFTLFENIYCFCQKFFQLKSFEEVEHLTMFDFMLARKAQYTTDLASAWSNYLQLQKYKKK